LLIKSSVSFPDPLLAAGLVGILVILLCGGGGLLVRYFTLERILASIRKICGCVQEPDYDYEEDHYTNYEVNDPPYKDVDADEENQYL